MTAQAMPPREDSPSFLIIHVTRIGDTLMGTPAIRAVARAYPGSEITCLAHPKRKTVLEHLPFVGHVGGITKNLAPWRGWLGGRRWDYALVFGFDQALVRYALRVADKVVAFRQKDPTINDRLFKVVEPPAWNSMHGVRQLLLLPAALGIAPNGHYLSYQVTEEEAAAARATLQRRLLQWPAPLVGLQIESFPTKPYRNWPVEHFLDLCERLLTDYPNAHFLLLGGKLPREKTNLFRQRLGDRVTIFAGKLTLRQSGAMMSLLDVYVGVDTGPTHLAGALGIPMVAMYHCLHPSEGLLPLEHPNLHVLDLPARDAGCGPQSSLGDIPVEAVHESVKAALAGGKSHG